MSTTINLAPDPQLMESIRAVGYTFSTALADIIDNSISAEAGQIQIVAPPIESPFVAILDDGLGMGSETATHAMRLAGTSPTTQRGGNDLGRFGLGLKTASLSQCRSLTIVSKKRGEPVVAYEWDLDLLAEAQAWSLLELSTEEIKNLPCVALLHAQESGTLVLWRKLDRLLPDKNRFEVDLADELARAKEHLGLVFHRFLAGDTGKALTILINGREVIGADPMLEGNPATLRGPVQPLSIEGETVTVRAFTLPHRNKLSDREVTSAQIGGSFRDSQGFYVYREKRLVIWGTWFRIVPKRELGKLARVRVDIPNSLDHLWALDIKKAQAMPPPPVRDHLKRIADRIVAPSQRVFTYKGRELGSARIVRVWNHIDERGDFHYELNRQHPLVASLKKTLHGLPHAQSLLEELLTTAERGFPVDDVYSRLGQDQKFAGATRSNEEMLATARSLAAAAHHLGLQEDQFVETYILSEPFSSTDGAEELLRSAYDGIA